MIMPVPEKAKKKKALRPCYAVFMFDTRAISELRQSSQKLTKDFNLLFELIAKFERLDAIIEPLDGK